MTKIRTIIIDDEVLAREGVALLLKDESEIELIGTCGDGPAALEMIRTHRPDLAFLDVHLPGLNGFEVLNKLAPLECPAVIFITAYDQYAVQAFEACAIDYLLKPLRDSRFKAALGRVKGERRLPARSETIALAESLFEHFRRSGRSSEPASSPDQTRLAFREEGDYLILDANDIVWIEAQGNRVTIGSTGERHHVRETLQSIEDRLDPARFFRVHRSFVVNIRHIRKIASALYGDYTLIMSDGAKIRLSRNYRDKLQALLP